MGVFSSLQTLTGDPFRDTLITVLGQTDEERGFLLNRVSPSIFVNKNAASFPIIGYADKIKHTAPRADDEPAKQTLKLGLTQVPFKLKAHDERIFLKNSDMKSDQAKGELLKISAAMALAGLISLKAEYDFIKKITDAANYPTDFKVTVGATDKFDYVSSGTYSDPVSYIVTKAGVARLLFGVYPDMVIFSESSWEKFISNPNVIDGLPSTVHGNPTEEDVVKLLKKAGFRQLKYLFISGAMHDQNANKKARSGADIMGDDLIIGKKAVEIGGGLVQAGAFVTAISDDSDDIGSMEYEPANKEKGIWVEDRLSLDNVIIKNEDEEGNDILYAFILKDTNT